MSYRSAVEVRDKEWWDHVPKRNKLRNQVFGFEIEDKHFRYEDDQVRMGMAWLQDPKKFLLIDDGYSEVINREKEFIIKLTVTPFTKEEIRVFIRNNFVVIRCERPPTPEGQAVEASLKLERSYVLPAACDRSTLTAKLRKFDSVVVVTLQKTENHEEQHAVVEHDV